MNTKLQAAAATLESLLLRREIDLSPVGRLSSAFQHKYEVAAMVDSVAYAFDPEEPASFKPEALGVMARHGWVYALTTWECELVYIGMTNRRLPDRIREHYTSHESSLTKRIRATRKYADLCFGWNVGDSALRYEAAAILLMQPIHNVKGMTP